MSLQATKQRISSLVASFVWALVGLTAAAVQATVTQAITVTSDNQNVLTVTTNSDGTYTVTVVGIGTANLVVTTAEDIVNGVPAITETFPFEVYDASAVATHFTATISDIVEHPQTAAAAAAPATATAAATGTAQSTTAAVSTQTS